MARLTSFSKMLVTIFILLIIVGGFSLTSGGGSCTRVNETKSLLRSHGYHPINVGGYGFMMCGEEDFYATKFTAYTPDSSKVVSGVVCKGVFKGATIRWNY